MDVLFGTSGIRGVVNGSITAELALGVGRALVRKNGSRVFVARDTRDSGLMLENALSAGIISAGGIAMRGGTMPTPTLAMASKEWADAGVMITASHNPPDYNGFKFFDRLGKEISATAEREIEGKLNGGWSGGWGIGLEEFAGGSIERHIEKASSLVDGGLIGGKAPKVVIDCANGAASLVAPYAASALGCRVVGVNCEPSGAFARELEPNAETLAHFSSIVRSVGGDMGIAYDGDADRAIILDETGELLGLDRQLSLMCRSILEEKKGAIISTIEASLAVRETIEKCGGKLATTKVGSRNVAELVQSNGALFGGEPCGEYVFPEEVLAADGILTSLKFIELLCREGKLSKLKKEIKSYPLKRAKFQCSKKRESMESIARVIKDSFRGKVSEGDGVRVDFEDGWLLVRASGTEPVIRVTVEHKSMAKLDDIYNRVAKIVRGNIK